MNNIIFKRQGEVLSKYQNYINVLLMRLTLFFQHVMINHSILAL